MNVRDWVAQHSELVPESLSERIMTMLGSDATADAGRASEVCLNAATRALNALLASGRYERDSALDLLAIDALTTFAYEHASDNGGDPATIKSLAVNGSKSLSHIPSANG